MPLGKIFQSNSVRLILWGTVGLLLAVAGFLFYDYARLTDETAKRMAAQTTNARGSLRIRTMPEGATVVLENVQPLKTPAVFENLKTGRHVVKISLEDYEPLELRLAVKEGRVADPGEIVLTRSRGNLRITTMPEGATFEVRGPAGEIWNGKTPALLKGLPTGRYAVTLKQAGWFPRELEGEVERNAIAVVACEFKAGTQVTEEVKSRIEMEGKTLTSRGDYEAAARQYRMLIDADPTNQLAHSNLGVVRVNQERWKEAEAPLKTALELDPKDVYSLILLGIVYSRTDRYDDAILTLTRALDVDSANPEAHYQLGAACMKKGNLENAEREFMEVVTLKPQHAKAHHGLALVYAHQKPPSLELAKRHYRQAVEMGVSKDPELEKLIGK